MPSVYDQGNLVLSTLGALTAITDATKVDAARLQGINIRKLKVAMVWRGKTAGEGPISYGLAVDMSAAEIKEAMAADPQNAGDPGASEEANRRIYPWGFIAPDTLVEQGYNGGPNFITLPDFPKWSVIEGKALFVYAFNHQASALTSGLVLNWFLRLTYDWRAD